MKKIPCYIPFLDGKPLINATGDSETEVYVTLDLLLFDDAELNRTVIIPGYITVEDCVA